MENKKVLGNRLKNLREEKDLYQKDLAKIFGISAGAIGLYENNRRTPDMELLKEMAEYFNVSTDYLLGKSDLRNPEEFYKDITEVDEDSLIKIPILGSIKAGEPILAEQNIIGYEYAEKGGYAMDKCFYLKVKGDSMNKSRIEDGDLVLVRPQNYVEDGDIAVVLVNGFEATLKKVYYADNGIILQPDSTNPKHKPIILNGNENLSSDVKILGKVIHAKIKF